MSLYQTDANNYNVDEVKQEMGTVQSQLKSINISLFQIKLVPAINPKYIAMANL
jgi:hypothetical protein